MCSFTCRTCDTNTWIKVSWWPPQKPRRNSKQSQHWLHKFGFARQRSLPLDPTLAYYRGSRACCNLTSPPRNSHQCEEGLCVLGSDFLQTTSDRKEYVCFGVSSSQVSDFNNTPPTTHRWHHSIDAHQMHVVHVTFWDFAIQDGFANRHSFSQYLHMPLLPLKLVGCGVMGIQSSGAPHLNSSFAH